MVRIKNEARDQIHSQTRQRLLDAAAHEFARLGYDAANINQISLSAGYAKGTIYNYFPSKYELMHDLLTQTAGMHLDHFSSRVSPQTDPLLRLDNFFKGGFSFVAENLDRMRVCVNVIYGADQGLKEFIFKAYQPLFAFVSREIVAHGIAAGAFRPVDPDAMGRLLLTIYLGTASQVSDDGFFFIPTEQVADFTRQALIAGNPPPPEGD